MLGGESQSFWRLTYSRFVGSISPCSTTTERKQRGRDELSVLAFCVQGCFLPCFAAGLVFKINLPQKPRRSQAVLNLCPLLHYPLKLPASALPIYTRQSQSFFQIGLQPPFCHPRSQMVCLLNIPVRFRICVYCISAGATDPSAFASDQN